MDTEHDLTLVVDEPIAGHFYWIVQRRADEKDAALVAIDSAAGPMPSYGAALLAGIAALQRRTSRSEAVSALGIPVGPASRHPTPDASGRPTLH